jgi:hypothetical protein
VCGSTRLFSNVLCITLTHGDVAHMTSAGKPMSFYCKPANRVRMKFTVGDWWTFFLEEKNNWQAYRAWSAKSLNLQAIFADQPMQ